MVPRICYAIQQFVQVRAQKNRTIWVWTVKKGCCCFFFFLFEGMGLIGALKKQEEHQGGYDNIWRDWGLQPKGLCSSVKVNAAGEVKTDPVREAWKSENKVLEWLGELTGSHFRFWSMAVNTFSYFSISGIQDELGEGKSRGTETISETVVSFRQ